MNYLSEMVSAAEHGAYQQRIANGTVFTVVVPLTDISPSPAAVIQDQVSQVIHAVERQGWRLDHTSTYNKGRGDADRALLIFRSAQPPA